MKLILTDHQARLVLEALEWAENPDYDDYDPANAAYIRIENKIRKELGKEPLKQETMAQREKREAEEERLYWDGYHKRVEALKEADA